MKTCVRNLFYPGEAICFQRSAQRLWSDYKSEIFGVEDAVLLGRRLASARLLTYREPWKQLGVLTGLWEGRRGTAALSEVGATKALTCQAVPSCTIGKTMETIS